MKLRHLFLLMTFIGLGSVLTYLILDHNFLPRKVLGIEELPEGTKVIEVGDNASIGTQTFVNHWLLSVSARDVAILISGRSYSVCPNSSDQLAKVSTLLKQQKVFSYNECYKYVTRHIVTNIYLNMQNEVALIEYITE